MRKSASELFFPHMHAQVLREEREERLKRAQALAKAKRRAEYRVKKQALRKALNEKHGPGVHFLIHEVKGEPVAMRLVMPGEEGYENSNTIAGSTTRWRGDTIDTSTSGEID